MGMALGAVADNGDVLALDKIDVGITIIIDTHFGEAPFGVVYVSQDVRLRAQSEMVKRNAGMQRLFKDKRNGRGEQ
jgi:hypothetical protein